MKDNVILAQEPAKLAPTTLATAEPSLLQRRFAAATIIALLALTAVAWPFADVTGPIMPGALAAYQTTVILSDGLTATLLLIQFMQLRTTGLLVLGCTYLFTAFIVTAHFLSFPDLLGPAGVIGGGSQTPPYLWLAWHTGFSLGVIAYAAAGVGAAQLSGSAGRAVGIGVLAVGALVAVITLLATAGHALLPRLLEGTSYASMNVVAIPVAVAFGVIATLAMARRRNGSIIALWLTVAMVAFTLDGLNVWNAGARYSVGWYVGRVNSFIASTLVLIVFIVENAFLVQYWAKASAALEAANAELAAARRRAETASQAKSRFLAAASHDLRQPMQAIRLFHSVLEGTAADPRQKGIIDSMGEAMGRSESLLNSLLDVARIESGGIAVNRGSVDLGALFESLAGEFRPAAEAKALALRVAPCSAWVLSDEILLKRIVSNLVSNALRYTERGGVLLACRCRCDHVLVQVWDTGVGIAPEHAEAIFEEFFQLGNIERDSRKGLGLGLSIVKGLSDLLGHRLTLRSAPGRGTVFTLTVPVVPSPSGRGLG